MRARGNAIGILVCTSKEVLKHKQRDGKLAEGNECYWTFGRIPRQTLKRLYFAVEGEVQGYFTGRWTKPHEFTFISEDWVKENGKTVMPSQGWRYLYKDDENGKQ